jgi:hypothetical protein
LLESSLETNKLETIILLLAPLLALALLAKKYRLSLRTLLRTLLRTKKACFAAQFSAQFYFAQSFFCHLPCHLLGCRLALVEFDFCSIGRKW